MKISLPTIRELGNCKTENKNKCSSLIIKIKCFSNFQAIVYGYFQTKVLSICGRNVLLYLPMLLKIVFRPSNI